jgi:L-ascorbate metabolism protein UlaG (beta-lactamase superfamily)
MLMDIAKQGPELRDEIESAVCPAPTLWWLGHSGFVLKYRNSIIYVDPYLSDSLGAHGRPRRQSTPLDPSTVGHAGLVLCTHPHPGHLDSETLSAVLEASPRARLVIPKTTAEIAHSMGISYHRMVTTDSGLRVEFLDDRVYAVPSAHDELDWTPLGGYPYLGYLIRFGGITIYHAGDCVPYPQLAKRLQPYTVNVALLPVSGRGPKSHGCFDVVEAAQLAEDIGAEWLIPMHYGVFGDDDCAERFVDHVLGHRPLQRFKVFRIGEQWTVPVS